MIRMILPIAALVLMASAAFAGFRSAPNGEPGQLPEDRVHANLIRVQVAGTWEDFPMVPLSNRLCESNSAIYRRYCE
ncbi:MAG: hypothetical protein AAFQ82_03855 [Myxococcota bacterium]